MERVGRRYYGWYIAATLAVTETISWGIVYYAFSVFVTPLEAEFGWSRTEITGAFSLALLISGAMAYPVGAWIDRHGARLLMTIGSVAACILMFAWSQVQSLPTLYLIWAGFGVCSAALLYEPAFAVIAVWFEKRRSQALALITFLGGLASTIFVPLSDALLQAVGWRQAIIILGVILGITTIPLHAFVLRRRPHDLGLLPDGTPHENAPAPRLGIALREALRSRSFWMLTVAFSLSNLAAAAIRFHLIPFLIVSGFSPSSAALVGGSMGILQVAGRVIFAPLEQRLSTRVISVLIFALEAGAIGILLFSVSVWSVGAFIVIFGAAYGAKALARPSMVGNLYGSSHYARISSIMTVFLTLTATAAPVGASYLYDQTGTYQLVLILTIGFGLLATSVMIIMKSTYFVR